MRSLIEPVSLIESKAVEEFSKALYDRMLGSISFARFVKKFLTFFLYILAYSIIPSALSVALIPEARLRIPGVIDVSFSRTSLFLVFLSLYTIGYMLLTIAASFLLLTPLGYKPRTSKRDSLLITFLFVLTALALVPIGMTLAAFAFVVLHFIVRYPIFASYMALSGRLNYVNEAVRSIALNLTNDDKDFLISLPIHAGLRLSSGLMGFLSVLAIVSGIELVMSLNLTGLSLILILAYMLTVPIAWFSIDGIRKSASKEFIRGVLENDKLSEGIKAYVLWRLSKGPGMLVKIITLSLAALANRIVRMKRDFY